MGRSPCHEVIVIAQTAPVPLRRSFGAFGANSLPGMLSQPGRILISI
jgi:hypothetical protein